MNFHQSAEPAEAPPAVIDPRPRQLLEKYASLTGGLLMDLGDGLMELEVPSSEKAFWGPGRKIHLALVPAALEEDPEAELLGLGSPLFERLLKAIRARGFHEIRGIISPTADPSAAAADLPVPLEGVTAGACRTELTLLPVGRLLARVSIKAGAKLEERLVESPMVDLSTGVQLMIPVPAERISGSDALPSGVVLAPIRGAQELLPLLFDELERELAADIARIRADASLHLKGEVDRLERYYGKMVEEVEPEDDPAGAAAAKQAFKAELTRRKDEEEERHRVRVTVHPLQLIEWRVLSQRAIWPLTTEAGGRGEVIATRLLVGEAEWRINCPTCGNLPGAIRLCAGGHAGCPDCSERCGVCSATTCRTHGLATCGIEGHAICAEHVRHCASCGVVHCSAHAGFCRVGDHEVCPTCAVQCGRCGVAICRHHATRTAKVAPRGERWVCGECTVYCEGGTGEPIGLDEAVRCSSCENHVCETHRVTCAVDQQTHCSKHLRKSDRSGRLLCEDHRQSCADEPGSVLASDEVSPCGSCGKVICDNHGGNCDADGTRHCVSHLAPLADRPGRKGCEQHRTVCHVDKVSYSLAGTKPCPVCDQPTCEQHRFPCSNCARHVCVRDVEGGKCVTCARLAEMADPSDDLIQAALVANGGEPPKAKGWKVAQDASGKVVELDLGWTRKLVFSVLHGEVKPRTVVMHGLLSVKRVR